MNQERRLNWGASTGRIPFLQGFQRYGQDDIGPYIGLIRYRIFPDADLHDARLSVLDDAPHREQLRRAALVVRPRGRPLLHGLVRRLRRRTAPLAPRARPPSTWLRPTSPWSATTRSPASRRRSTAAGSGSRWAGRWAPWTSRRSSRTSRRYLSPNRNLTFAARGMHFGRYGANLDPNRSTAAIQPYFLGYENLIRGYSYESFDVDECSLTSVESGAVAGNCAGFDRLFGHKLAVANLEMRVPVLGTPAIRAHQLPVPADRIPPLRRCRARLEPRGRGEFRLRPLRRQARPGLLGRRGRPLQHLRIPDPRGLLREPLPAPRQGPPLGLRALARLVAG